MRAADTEEPPVRVIDQPLEFPAVVQPRVAQMGEFVD
jgi:hypothetical protein